MAALSMAGHANRTRAAPGKASGRRIETELFPTADRSSWCAARATRIHHEERIVPELAWLSYLRGEWLLVTARGEGNLRAWTDRALALQELELEGWTIARPAARRPSDNGKMRRSLLGYCLKRTVH